MNDDFNEQSMREELLLHLAQDKMKNSLTFEELVNSPDEIKQHFSDLNLIELLALQKSAKNNIDDARLFAVYLFEQLNGSKDLSDIIPTKEDGEVIEKIVNNLKNNLSDEYQDILGDIVEQANDADASYLLAKAQLESNDHDLKVKGLQNMKLLINQQEYPDLAEKAKAVINNIISKRQLEKDFCTQLLKVLGILKRSGIDVNEFKNISDIYTANRIGNELNYNSIIIGLTNVFKNVNISKMAEMNLNKSDMTQQLFGVLYESLKNFNKDGHALKKLNDFSAILSAQKSIQEQRASPSSSPRKE